MSITSSTDDVSVRSIASIVKAYKRCSPLFDYSFYNSLPLFFNAEVEEQRKLEEKMRQRVDDETEYPHRKRNIFLAGVATVAAFAAYAFLAGLVSIDFVKVDERSSAASDEAEVIRVSSDNDDSND